MTGFFAGLGLTFIVIVVAIIIFSKPNMADMTASRWTSKFPVSYYGTFAPIAKSGEDVYFGAYVSINPSDGYAYPFDVSDSGYKLVGIHFGPDTTGDGTLTLDVRRQVILEDATITGVAITDIRKAVFATSDHEQSLTYAVGSQVVGFVEGYTTTNTARLLIYPMEYVEETLTLGTYAYDEVGSAGDFIYNADLRYDVIIRYLSGNPIVAYTATKGEDFKAWNAGNVLTGTLELRNADTVGTVKRQAITDHANCYIAAGGDVKVEYDANEGVNPDAGKATLFLEVDRIPKCPIL